MTDGAVPQRTLAREFLTPRSLGLLVLFLLLAGVFAALMQWQLSRAVQQGTVEDRSTERVLPLSQVARPDAQQTDASVGQAVSAQGRLVPQDTLIAGDRLNRGDRGWWVVGHASLDGGAQLALGLGWAPTEQAAQRAAAAVRSAPAEERTFVGRYVDSDAATPTASGDPDALVGVSSARLVNLWTVLPAGAPVYEGLMTLREPPADTGLTAIYSPKPGEQVELNLLNVLYAVEWALFAVFALYIWYRLIRDRWEAGQQPAEDAEPVPVDA